MFQINRKLREAQRLQRVKDNPRMSTFTIAESNDRRYNLTWNIVASIGILTPCITLYFNFFDIAPILFCTITLLSLIGIYIIRFFFNDYKKVGNIKIYDNQIILEFDGKSEEIIDLKKIDFYYQGYFGTSTMTGRFPRKDGTGNIITFIHNISKTNTVNIYLDNRDEKKELIDSLTRFSKNIGIPIDTGILISW